MRRKVMRQRVSEMMKAALPSVLRRSVEQQAVLNLMARRAVESPEKSSKIGDRPSLSQTQLPKSGCWRTYLLFLTPVNPDPCTFPFSSIYQVLNTNAHAITMRSSGCTSYTPLFPYFVIVFSAVLYMISHE
ncbi:hypothetical protein F5146DRAFT_1228706, partial [Armillaria mellea]